MNALLVFVNGERICVAGIEYGVVGTHVGWTGSDKYGKFSLRVGGLDGRTVERVRWLVPNVGVGDEITIRIVEVDKADPPSERFKNNGSSGVV